MQFKFFVDGEWQHDDHQPYMSGEYGTVNTVFLTAEPSFMPGINPLASCGSNMDVDNEAFQRVVRVNFMYIYIYILGRGSKLVCLYGGCF